MSAYTSIYDFSPTDKHKDDSYLAVNIPVLAFYILIPVAYVALVYVSQYNFPVIFVALITENYWGENATFFAFITAAFLLVLLTLQPGPRLRRLTWLAGASVAAFIAFEEISWGMWLHGLGPPQWLKEINNQDELTIHNIQGLVEHKELIQSSVAWLLVFWSILSVSLISLRNQFLHRPITTILPVFPLRVIPCALIVAWLLVSKPFIKSEEIAELGLALCFLMWTSDLYATFGSRRFWPVGPLLRSRAAVLTGVFVVTAAFSLAAKVYFPQAINGRLTRTAVENYPDRQMMAQSRALFDYLFEHPQYMSGATLDGYDDLFVADEWTDRNEIYVFIPDKIQEISVEQ